MRPVLPPGAQENIRLFNKLSQIEDLDSSQVLQASTVRSSLNTT